ncbi:MAG TPA: DUF4136 domain-containing protein [Stenotrophomonas sp.]|nr:DUF4136 domain-containing protein [Stenotrophomonas sp.]
MRQTTAHRRRSILRVTVLALACASTALGLGACASSAERGAAATPEASVRVTVPASQLPGPRYAWVPMPHEYTEQADPRVLDPAFRQRLRTALDAALAARGYQRVEQVADADWVAAYRVGVRDSERMVPATEAAGSGATRMNAIQCTSSGCSQLVVPGNDGSLVLDMRRVSYVEGALQVEAVDPKSAQVLWSATNRGTVRRSDGRQARLDAIAAQTLQALPAAR